MTKMQSLFVFPILANKKFSKKIFSPNNAKIMEQQLKKLLLDAQNPDVENKINAISTIRQILVLNSNLIDAEFIENELLPFLVYCLQADKQVLIFQNYLFVL